MIMKMNRDWGDGRVGRTKNLSPHWVKTALLDSIWWNHFGTLESIEGLQLPGEVLDANLCLISVKFSSVAAIHPLPQPYGRQLSTCSWQSLCTACRSPSGQKRSCPPNIEDLCSHWWFWSQRGRQRGGQPFLLHLPTLLQVPSSPTKVTSRGFKELTPFLSLSVFFPLLGARQ